MPSVNKVLITGGAGFCGAHICQHLCGNTDWDVVVLDRMTYAGSLERLADVRRDYPERLRFVFHDFRAPYPPSVLHALKGVRWVIHNGAETHVDRSLKDSELFVQSNVLGTLHTLEAARTLGVEHFLYVSTDEVLGAAPDGISFNESAPIRPSNPYSAAKAGGEALVHAFTRMGLPCTISRTTNLFGERQHPEKFIPLVIRKLLQGEALTIHGHSNGHIGSRKWLHARNQASALMFLLSQPPTGAIYHIAGEEWTNLGIAALIADELKTTYDYDVIDAVFIRPGYDFRYSLDDTKLRSLGWFPPVPFGESLRRTVRWFVKPENQYWLEQEAVHV